MFNDIINDGGRTMKKKKLIITIIIISGVLLAAIIGLQIINKNNVTNNIDNNVCIKGNGC